MRRTNRFKACEAPITDELVELVQERARPLTEPTDLDPLIDRIGDARFVLLGEASHGTAEYYTWRTAISRRLIQEKGFDFIAVEGDWPACDAVDGFIRGGDDGATDARETLQAFDRWPTWMWANEEIAVLASWLRSHHASVPEGRRVGFHGLDVYSLWESLYAVLGYLRRHAPESIEAAQEAFACFEPYGEDPQQYARATAALIPDSCREEVVALLARMRREASRPAGADNRDAAFRAEQNALVVKNAEAYYRTMVEGGPASWNIRDRHMAETLERLSSHYGPQSKAIVWEHNTHIGDARFTDMADDGMINIGQLVRERFEDQGVVLVGFGSHRGSVIAGRHWEAPMQQMEVPKARDGSWEDLLHQAVGRDSLLLFEGRSEPGPLRAPRGHRAIGVVYRPEVDHLGNYVPSVLPMRYDAFLFLDESHALHPLPVTPAEEKLPETFPSGT